MTFTWLEIAIIISALIITIMIQSALDFILLKITKKRTTS
jgi:hypothetical protein